MAEGVPAGARALREVGPQGAIPLYHHPEWTDRFPWLVNGTTGRGERSEAVDMGLFGGTSVGAVVDRWRLLREQTEMQRSVHARQVHGRDLLCHGEGAPGLAVAEGMDGHLTRRPGVLLTVSVADCVPIAIVDGARRAIALLHAGWRGAAAGILEAGVAALGALAGSRPADLHVHCGPAICGRCYEVGPEVHAALGLTEPAEPQTVDLRAALARRAIGLGIEPRNVTVSAHCTRCGDGGFFSHRGGDAQRQIGVLGLRQGA